MEWIACELHSHTVHSDGAMEPAVLAAEARASGFAALALTDHNTLTGRVPFAAAAQASGLVPLPGVELTTFFGHVLVWGAGAAPDWRTLGPRDLGPALAALGHRTSIAVGAAHPFRPGNPYCTGCFWEYELPFDDLDCLEVWSGLDPDLSADNRRALGLWGELLNQGVRITATAGRDWHRADPAPGLKSTTYLGVPEGFAAAAPSDQAALAVAALRAGRAVLSLGPLVLLTAAGQTLSADVLDTGWGLPLAQIVDARAVVVTDGGTPWRWARAEVHGRVAGQDRVLAIGNPIWSHG